MMKAEARPSLSLVLLCIVPNREVILGSRTTIKPLQAQNSEGMSIHVQINDLSLLVLHFYGWVGVIRLTTVVKT